MAAIAADSEDAWAHTALGSVYFSTRRLDHSLAEFELALQLNPNFSLAQGYYALALCYSGRWQDAYAATQRAIRQSPRDPSSAIYYGVARLRPVRRQELSGSDCTCARGDPSTRRSHRRLPGADGRRRHGRPDRARQERRCRSCAGPSPIFHWPGSRPSYPGSSTPIASIIWKAFAAPDWSRLRRNRSGVTAASPRTTTDPARPSRRSRRECRSPPAPAPPPRRNRARPRRRRPGPRRRGRAGYRSPWS